MLLLGVVWVGGSDEVLLEWFDVVLIFVLVGVLVLVVLWVFDKGGIVVCGGIYMSDILSFLYVWLWGECCIVLVVNLMCVDVVVFMWIVVVMLLWVEVVCYVLIDVNSVFDDLCGGCVLGVVVLGMYD